jgi:hypothetical protein
LDNVDARAAAAMIAAGGDALGTSMPRRSPGKRRHWRAKLSDHEVELLLVLLNDRRQLIKARETAGDGQGGIDQALKVSGLSWRALAAKFDVSVRLVRLIASDERRQTVWREE